MRYELTIACDTAEELAEIASALEILAAQRVQNAANKAVVVEILAGSELDAQGIDGSFRFKNEAMLLPQVDQATGGILKDPFAEPPKLEPGMYRTGMGQVVRVYKAQSGSHLLAKALEGRSDGSWSFTYLGAAPRFVTPEQRMRLEEAKAWGAEFGTCCVCAALLSDPESVAAGIGPICGSRV